MIIGRIWNLHNGCSSLYRASDTVGLTSWRKRKKGNRRSHLPAVVRTLLFIEHTHREDWSSPPGGEKRGRTGGDMSPHLSPPLLPGGRRTVTLHPLSPGGGEFSPTFLSHSKIASFVGKCLEILEARTRVCLVVPARTCMNAKTRKRMVSFGIAQRAKK